MAVFRVGQKVVCVDASPGKRTTATPFVEGAVYVIRAIRDPWIALVGISEEWAIPPFIGGWEKRRFRPAVDIEQFRALVEPAALQQIKRKLVDA